MKLSDFTNLSGQFVKPSGEGFLLSNLGIFTSRPSDTQIIALDTLEDVQREVTKSVARYGSEMSAINFPKAANSFHCSVVICSPAGRRRELCQTGLLTSERRSFVALNSALSASAKLSITLPPTTYGSDLW